VFTLQPGLLVDLARYDVQRGNQHIPLRAREAELLRILLRQPGRYVKAEILAEAIGSEGSEAPEHPVEEMISHLRRKLGETPHHPKLIRCKRYAGYAIFPEVLTNT
jgi:DNA-binding response OmpR family regulator